jgi:hypothetical protein
MADTERYTPDEFERAIRAVCLARPSALPSILEDWEQVRAKLREQGLPDPGPMSEDDLRPYVLSEPDATAGEEAGEEADVVLEYRIEGERKYHPFADFDVVTGGILAYDEDVPVLAVDEASGAITATVPADLLPLFDDLRIRDKSGWHKLSLPRAAGGGAPNLTSGTQAPAFLGSGESTSQADDEGREVAHGQVPPDVARKLLARVGRGG